MTKNNYRTLFMILLLAVTTLSAHAQERRPIDNEHPLWFIHIDVWNSADPQKIIDLIPEDIKPYVCMNLSLSCQYDKERNIYKMPRCAVRTYKSWASVCQQNGLWFTCQPASGGHTHIQDNDLETFEYFFKRYPNFLGWNYAEQFWGFDEAGDKSSSTQSTRWALFAKLVEMSHRYGGFLTISFCGNIWSHGLNPNGEMKREPKLLEACKKYPEAILWLYKYTTSTCFYNNESVSIAPFISGLAKNYGVRYDNCGWNGAMEALIGKDKCKYPVAAGVGTVMEQTGINGGAVWDGPELIWTEDFHNLNPTWADGYSRRQWETYPGFQKVWIDMFRKVIDGKLRIPSRAEVVGRTKVVVVDDVNVSDDDAVKYASWGSLYDGLYKQDDPTNRGNGQWENNLCYFKKTGRYATIPVTLELYDDLAKSIPVKVMRSQSAEGWNSLQAKVAEFNAQYPEVSSGDLFVARNDNQLVTYTPYTYLNSKTTAEATIPLQYNTCQELKLTYGKLSSGLIHEYGDHIDFYLNNTRTDTTTVTNDIITVKGATTQPTYSLTKRQQATCTVTPSWDAATASYTLTVSHQGPVDISIQCAGSASRTATAPAPSHLPVPKQPEKSRLPLIIEAEDMDTKNVQNVALTNSGWYAVGMYDYAGNGFVEMGTNQAGSLRHQQSFPEAGDYTITVRYTSPSTSGYMTAVVNGEYRTVNIERTATSEWRKATFQATLKAGINDLRLNNVNGLPVTIDQIIYTPAGTEPEKFLVTIRDAELGTVTPSVSEAAEGDVVTLSVAPEAGCQLTELRVINSVYYTMEKTIVVSPGEDKITFTMPDDNVTIQPVFEDMATAYQLDFSNALAGGLPQGWRCVQENNETHQYPNTYTLGARTMAGFTGYQGKAIYWREQYAEYGAQTTYPLYLEAGNYKLTFAMAAWKESPTYKAQVLNSSGSAVATSEVYTATPNANGSGSANLSSATVHELPVLISQPGNYIIRFSNQIQNGWYDEFLLLQCKLRAELPAAITDIAADERVEAVYSVSGIRQPAISKGLNIVRTADGKTRKVLRR